MNLLGHHIYPLGETAITIEMGKEMDEAINRKALAIFRHIQQQQLDWIRDIIPAYTTVTIVYDLQLLQKMNSTKPLYQFVQQQLEQLFNSCQEMPATVSRKMEIPVCYHKSLGLDLEQLSKQKDIPVEEIIKLHTSKAYRVYMVGFLPGFAYMGTVDETIAAPRLQTPRTFVPAGSVGIAGMQTGIYPIASPGGWNIIGRTPVNMFKPKSSQPILLQAGDEVQFVQISLEAFNNYNQQTWA